MSKMWSGPARSNPVLEDSMSYLIDHSIDDDEGQELALPLVLGESMSTWYSSLSSNVGDTGHFVTNNFSSCFYENGVGEGRNSDGGRFLPEVVEVSSNSRSDFEINSSGAMFLRAIREIFAEIAFYANKNNETDNGVNSHFGNGILAFEFTDNSAVFQDNRQAKTKKTHLLDLLQLVDDHYNRCVHQIHTVSSAFHTVTDLDPNLHTRFVLPALSSMYKSLREKFATHILSIGTLTQIEGHLTRENDEKRWGLIKRDPQQLWKPQRGLPERSVSILKAWMFQNFLHPYPKDADKHLLALKSGLTRNQVSNWFINARVRVWKPMIEEMYTELQSKNSTK